MTIRIRECGHSYEDSERRYRKHPERCWYCQPPLESLSSRLERARKADLMAKLPRDSNGRLMPRIKS
jgi:hypothetical protein